MSILRPSVCWRAFISSHKTPSDTHMPLTPTCHPLMGFKSKVKTNKQKPMMLKNKQSSVYFLTSKWHCNCIQCNSVQVVSDVVPPCLKCWFYLPIGVTLQEQRAGLTMAMTLHGNILEDLVGWWIDCQLAPESPRAWISPTGHGTRHKINCSFLLSEHFYIQSYTPMWKNRNNFCFYNWTNSENMEGISSNVCNPRKAKGNNSIIFIFQQGLPSVSNLHRLLTHLDVWP